VNLDDAEHIALDAEIYLTAHNIAQLAPDWFRDLNDRHHAETQRLRDTGDHAAAEVFERHALVFDFEDGPECGADGPYPCMALRAAHDGSRVWQHITDTWAPGWEARLDEFTTDDDSCARDARDLDIRRSA